MGKEEEAVVDTACEGLETCRASGRERSGRPPLPWRGLITGNSIGFLCCVLLPSSSGQLVSAALWAGCLALRVPESPQ